MRNEGITLIELLMVVSIIGILIIITGYSFTGWRGNYQIEDQTKTLYSDLMDARVRAMTRDRMHFAVLAAGNYALFEDTNNNNSAEPGAGDNAVPGFTTAKTVLHELGWTGTIMFNARGLSDSEVTIPVTLPGDVHPDYDCINVYRSRIRMGQMSGGTCAEK
jgi:Tfp pilus assembly protein FimT